MFRRPPPDGRARSVLSCPMNSESTTRRRAPALLVALLAMSCAPAGAEGAFRSSPSPTTEVRDPGEDVVIDAYRHFHAVAETALATDDPRGIREVAVGAAAD